MDKAQQALDRITRSEHGIETRAPIELILDEANKSIGASKLSRLIFAGELFEFIDHKTKNQEVIDARNGREFLGNYLDEIEEQISSVEKLLFDNTYVPPDAPTEANTSDITFNIIREEA